LTTTPNNTLQYETVVPYCEKLEKGYFCESSPY
jgi:hypothetical protein